MTNQLQGTTPPPEPERYRFALSHHEVSTVLRYTHVYPNLHGYTQRFFSNNYPGYSLASFMQVFQAAGILTKKGSSAPGGRCRDELHTFYFNSTESFYVQWHPAGSKTGEE